jgi:hypothetical protein
MCGVLRSARNRSRRAAVCNADGDEQEAITRSQESAMRVRAHGFRAPRPKLAGGRSPAQAASGRTAPRAAGAPRLAGRHAVLAATVLVMLGGATAGCAAPGTSAATPPAAITGAATGGTRKRRRRSGRRSRVLGRRRPGHHERCGRGGCRALLPDTDLHQLQRDPVLPAGIPGCGADDGRRRQARRPAHHGRPGPVPGDARPRAVGLRANRMGAVPAERQRDRLTGRLPRLRRHRAWW